MRKKKYTVFTPHNLKPSPSNDEKIIAEVMANFLKSNIIFVLRNSATTPDIKAIASGQYWEIKNIRGNNKNTISRALKGIYRQSENVILSLLRTQMPPQDAVGRARQKLSRANRIKRLVIITKNLEILVIKP